jgi:HEAT repeat protein
MPDAISIEIEGLKSSNQNIAANAYQNLIVFGRKATPHLLKVLAEDENNSARALATEALANISDPSSQDKMYFYLNDINEKVRSWSAVTLRKLNDPRAKVALIRTINDTPDLLHADQTLSTYALIAWGAEILPDIIPLLNVTNFSTRRRAFSVVSGIVNREFVGELTWQEIWKNNGSFLPEMEEKERLICIEKWKEWINNK